MRGETSPARASGEVEVSGMDSSSYMLLSECTTSAPSRRDLKLRDDAQRGSEFWGSCVGDIT